MPTDGPGAGVELPSLDPGVTLLETDGRATGPLQSLVLDRVLLAEGDALWIDARGHATTQALAGVAPSARVLDRVLVARAFTAFQHYAAVADLDGALSSAASLLVLPAVDWLYRADDLRRGEGREMLTAALATARERAAAAGVPVLVTRHEADGPGECVADVADRRLSCTQTRFGPRFSGPEFETLVYHDAGGVQTTLAFWRRVLARRHGTDALESAPAPEVASVGPN